MNPDKVSYLVLFCSMLLIQKSVASFEEVVPLLPSVGRAKQLAERMLSGQQVA